LRISRIISSGVSDEVVFIDHVNLRPINRVNQSNPGTHLSERGFTSPSGPMGGPSGAFGFGVTPTPGSRFPESGEP